MQALNNDLLQILNYACLFGLLDINLRFDHQQILCNTAVDLTCSSNVDIAQQFCRPMTLIDLPIMVDFECMYLFLLQREKLLYHTKFYHLSE